ncbi:DGQHR domain-containing protein [Leisingera sp. M523]|uniref:DGQHR domain-containing protein n=1 Tax=Leisingera sp. M523 TaxID=2867013 RepID=UPI0021A8E15F|nr:DGQHR domain-containing protein [Leisingera sp. M523]UWQ27280.1 DGQHR domain-containing protein [Leisingera sp. M523]
MARESYAAVLLTQGEHRFYQLAMPSDVLGECTFVTTRDTDPEAGFQRLLDKKRATEIANYIDSGHGTIPTSVILSAQEVCHLEYDSRNKTISFEILPSSFLILDGQHRVYGFKISDTKIRVPVIIYDGLNRRDESRLFIDINSKQRGVPSELLLDIKNQAEYENSEEQLFREVFDLMSTDPTSPLFGRLSPSKRAKSKISRVTFNAALKSIYPALSSRTPVEIQEILSDYIASVRDQIIRNGGDEEVIMNSVTFRALTSFFIQAARRVKDRFGPDYSVDNFNEVLMPLFDSIQLAKLSGTSQAKIIDYLDKHFKGEFQL